MAFYIVLGCVAAVLLLVWLVREWLYERDLKRHQREMERLRRERAFGSDRPPTP
jgi:uncharacterized membrane-anchored protein